MKEPSTEKINQWCDFINQYLYECDFINFMNAGSYTGDEFKFMFRTKDKQKKIFNRYAQSFRHNITEQKKTPFNSTSSKQPSIISN